MLLQDYRPERAGHLHRKRRRRPTALIAVVLTLVLLASPATSYVRALTAPGNVDWQVRTVEWIRDHGGGPVVDTVENWWYSHNQPTGTAPAAGSLPTAANAAPGRGAGPGAAQPPPLPLLPGATPLPDEGTWVGNPQTVGGAPALYTGFFRPDPTYPSQIVGVAWTNQDLVSTHLIAGTQEPVPGTAPGGAEVPPNMRDTLLAAFNSGWKMRDSRGGYYANGTSAVALQNGAASLVIDDSGRVKIGRWGQDVGMGPQIAAVRQNLDLVVDGGRPAAGLSDNATGAWGSPKNQFQYTWRSGLGTDRGGNLIYVAGDQLSLAGLADAMVAAGIQRGMELDIHPKMVAFNSFHPTAGQHFGLAATKLLPAMVPPATRYLVPDTRDFIAVTLRSPR